MTRALPRGWGKGRSKAAAKRRARRDAEWALLESPCYTPRGLAYLVELPGVGQPRDMYFLNLSTTARLSPEQVAQRTGLIGHPMPSAWMDR